MKLGSNRWRLPLLVGMVIACASLGGGVSHLLRHYNAALALPQTDFVQAPKETERTDPLLSFREVERPGFITSFRDIEVLWGAPVLVDRFVASSGMSPDPARLAFRDQMTSGSGNVRITQEWIYSKPDLRNVPDQIAQTAMKSQPERVSAIRVSADEKTAEDAVKMVETATMFIRFVLVDQGLRRSVEDWRQLTPDTAIIDADILGLQWQLESLDRQIVSVRGLQESQANMTPAADVGENAVRLLVEGDKGATYLTLDRQITGLRSQRIILTERLKRKEDELSRLKMISKFADQIAALLAQEADSFQALAKAQQLALRWRQDAKSIAERQAAAAINGRLWLLQKSYVQASTNPPQAFASAVGPRVVKSMLIGGAMGFLGWITICYVTFVWGPQLQVLRRKLAAG